MVVGRICPLAFLGRRLLQRLLRRGLEGIRLVRSEVVVISNFIKRALDHELIVAIELRLVPTRVRELHLDLLPLIARVTFVVLLKELLLRHKELFHARLRRAVLF